MENMENRYLDRLSDLYPTIAAASTEIINLQAILNLPKGTEHFLTDVHGEDEAFSHVLRNGSGAVRSKIEDVFGNTMSVKDKKALATLIYYPKAKMEQVKRTESNMDDWYRVNLYRLIEVSKRAASKYTRSKVRKSLPKDFSYVIEELITEKAEVSDKESYYNEIISTIIRIGRAEEFIATSWWLLVIVSVINTIIIYSFSSKILGLLGADGIILTNATDYIKIIALGAILQILGTGMMPFIRNYGNSFWSMFAMVGGFITNIVLDFIFVWIYEMGMKGAATATIAGQGVTAAIAIIYALYNKKFYVYVSLKNVKEMCGAIFRVGLAPFGLALTPNISLVFINRFSASYGGEKAIATYACVSYIICIIYLILQGVGDGSQPLMSRFYGEKDQESLRGVQRMAYIFAIILAVCGGIIMYVNRANIGGVFGASYEVSIEISKIVPIFLVSLPFVAITRIATAGFYATEKSGLSYILTFIEPVLMLIFMLVLPPLFGGQIMIWWSTVLARVFSAILAFILIKYCEKGDLQYGIQKI